MFCECFTLLLLVAFHSASVRKGEIVLDGQILQGDWKADRGRWAPVLFYLVKNNKTSMDKLFSLIEGGSGGERAISHNLKSLFVRPGVLNIAVKLLGHHLSPPSLGRASWKCALPGKGPDVEIDFI